MRSETISIHGGFDCDPATKAVAPPIYQTVAYEFDSADHGAALFNLEAEGFRYSRIANPTTEILEKRVALLEGGASALAVASGQAALAYAFLTLADHGGSIVAPPTLYGTTHTLLAHTLRHNGVEARFASKRARRGHGAADRRNDARRVLRVDRQSRRQRLRHRRARRAGARARRAADRRQHRRDADPVAADRARRRHRRPFADQVHGRPRRRDGRRDRRRRPLRLARPGQALPAIHRTGRILSRPRLRRPLRPRRVSRPRAQRLSAHDRRGAGADERLPAAAGHRDAAAAHRAPRRQRPRGRRMARTPTRASPGSITPACPTAPISRWRRNISADAPLRC